MKSSVNRVKYNNDENYIENQPQSKTVVDRIIEIMVKNRHRSMDDTVDTIMKEVPLNPIRALASARSYYIDLTRAGVAPGNIELHRRGRKPSTTITLKNKQITIMLSNNVKFVGYLQENTA